ncbi:MAG TPA: flagellar FlbD family protein [Spirochaetota bacterium]|nr:flagellar FlbD family protein [Spirochaetota bacterium]HPJ33857.1 flagellar FlbD family protein [Spirochaetota bacterium]
MIITLHKLNDESFFLNAYHVEIIESKPDTVITLTNDRKYIVKESPDEVIEMINAAARERYSHLKR